MSEWINVEETLPDQHLVCQAKRENGEELKAMFYTDGMQWIAFYGMKPTAWWAYYTKKPIYDVTHWKERSPKIKDKEEFERDHED